MSLEPTAMRNRSPAIFILVLLDMTPELLTSTMPITITSVLLRLATKVTTPDLNVRINQGGIFFRNLGTRFPGNFSFDRKLDQK